MEKKEYPVYFPQPAQVMYFDYREEDEPRLLTGIAFRQEIICGCCGGVIDINKLVEAGKREGHNKVVFPYNTWEDISEAIDGGEYPPGLACGEDGKSTIITEE